jgi:hypothetical protein
MTRLLFIGECRSLTAKSKGWTWEDGRLAAKPLFEALEAMGVNPKDHEYTNLWMDTSPPVIAANKFEWLRMKQTSGSVLVALGKRVSGQLEFFGVDHVALVHPAARGKIRKRERYHAHVKKTLAPVVASSKLMHVRCAREGEGTCYIFEVETARGKRRVYPPGIGKHDEAATTPSGDLRAWLKRLGVTHVQSLFGESKTSRECIADGRYTVAKYIQWWKRAEETEA